MIHARSVLVVAVALFLVVGMLPAPAAGQEEVTLTVTVVTNDGESVSDAVLTATWDGGESTAETAANGKAFLDVAAGEDIEIAVDHPEFIRNSPFTVADAGEQDVTVTVYPRASTSFQVRDADGKVNDASVTLFRHGGVAFAEQTEDGIVETGDIEAGTYTLLVEKSGYYDTSQEIEIAAGDSDTRTVTIERGTITLHFNVTDPYFSPPRPIEGVTAAIEGVGSAQTQSNGKQQINVPVNTELTVTFTKDGYDTVERTVTTEETDRTIDVGVSRSAELEVSVLNDQVVVGQPVFIEVVDEYDDPVANGTVLLDGNEVATTDGDGRARLTVDTEGEHSIRVQKAGVDSGETVVTGVVIGTTTQTTTSPSETTTTTSTTTPPTTQAPIPGFGPVVAVLGIVLGAGLVALRWRRR